MTPADRIAALAACFESRRDALVADLEALVVRESPSDDAARVSALARFLAGRLASAGVEAATVPCSGRGDALVARSGIGAGTLLLGHLDTVWPAGTLAEIPFQVVDGVATGPGSFDMKAGIAVGLSVLSAAASGDVRPARGVTLLLTPDEEVGSEASRELLVAEALKHERVLVLEPSGDGGAAKVARKGVGIVRARFDGVAAHAGLEPEKGASALLEMARFLLFADALADRNVGTSVVPTIGAAGTKANVVPERADVTVDFRIWSREEGARVASGLASYRPVDPRVRATITGGLNRLPMEESEASASLYWKAAALAKRIGFEMASVRVGGASDGNLTAAAGVPTLDGLGPAGGGAHARTEHVLVDDLPRRAALLAALLEEVAP